MMQAKRVVEEQYKKAHQHHGRESLDGLAVKDVLAKLTQGIFETKGGMKNVREGGGGGGAAHTRASVCSRCVVADHLWWWLACRRSTTGTRTRTTC